MWYFAWLDGDNRCLFFETKEERAHWVAKGPGRDMIAYSDPRAIKVRESKFFEHCDRVRRLREQVRAELGGSGRGIGAVPNAAEAAGGREMNAKKTIGLEYWLNNQCLSLLEVPVDEARRLIRLRLAPGWRYLLQEPMPGIPEDEERYRRQCEAVGVAYTEEVCSDGTSEYGPYYTEAGKHRPVRRRKTD